MRIGELAQQSGISTRTLRHYEDLGLLSAERSSNGYRNYGAEHLRLVGEIRSLVDLGFALEQTRPFLQCLQEGNLEADSCPDSIAMYRQKLVEVDEYVDKLQQIQSELQRKLAHAVAERSAPRCLYTPTT